MATLHLWRGDSTTHTHGPGGGIVLLTPPLQQEGHRKIDSVCVRARVGVCVWGRRVCVWGVGVVTRRRRR